MTELSENQKKIIRKNIIEVLEDVTADGHDGVNLTAPTEPSRIAKKIMSRIEVDMESEKKLET